MVLVFRVIPYYRITRYFPMLVFREIPYYRIIRYFPITVLISRAGSELFGGWTGCGVGCDDSMEESAIAIPDCIPALDSRDSTARIVRIAYPQTFVPSVIRLAVQTPTLQTTSCHNIVKTSVRVV